MPPIPILLYGATGRMGRAIRAALRDAPDLALRWCVAPEPDTEACPAGCEWATPDRMLEGAPGGLVVIDVSLAAGTARLLDRLERSPLALVSATTGLTEADEARVRALGGRAAVLRARNLSPGNSVVGAMLRSLSPPARDLFECDVVEHHHAGKKDAPSGTALAWASLLAPAGAPRAGARGTGPTGSRARGEVRIHSIRAGTATGTHRALLAGDGETVEIVHTVFDRAVFARGALRAARFLHGRAPGYYTFDDALQSP